jgi:hypothetical protein
MMKKQLSTQWKKRLPYPKMNGSIAQFIRRLYSKT